MQLLLTILCVGCGVGRERNIMGLIKLLSWGGMLGGGLETEEEGVSSAGFHEEGKFQMRKIDTQGARHLLRWAAFICLVGQAAAILGSRSV